MVDTVREVADLQTLLADNTAGDISPQDARDVLVSTSPLIERQVLTGTTASFDFTSIPDTFDSLLLVVQARSSHSDQVNLLMRFNGDTGGNYNWQWWVRESTTSGGGRLTAQTSIGVGNIQGTNATAGKASVVEIVIFNYKRTTFHKNVRADATNWNVTSGPGLAQNGGDWADTAAITQVTLLPATGSFIAGSVASLYGLS